MTDRPILFSGEMVRAILDGRKTQTRRVVKPQPSSDWHPIVGPYHPTVIDRYGDEQPGAEIYGAADENEGRKCFYGQPGDRLWVRETWQDYCPTWNGGWCGCGSYEMIRETHRPVYRADAPELQVRNGATPMKWRPSIFMPRWASRLTLEITGVRVERLRDILPKDAIAEGMPCTVFARSEFATLWDAINGKRAPWASNPFVWVLEFKPVLA